MTSDKANSLLKNELSNSLNSNSVTHIWDTGITASTTATLKQIKI